VNPEGIAGANRIVYDKIRTTLKERRAGGGDGGLVPLADAAAPAHG
jgi:hypothetical protein